MSSWELSFAVQTEPKSFSWREDFDESLNFWFWLRGDRRNR